MNIPLSNFKRVPLSTLRAALRSSIALPGARTSDLARACGVGEGTVKKALLVLSEFQLIEGDDTAWRAVPDSVGRSAKDGDLDFLIREALLAYRPFEGICEGLLVGESYNQAVRHAAVLLGLDGRAETNIDLLRQWGHELGVLDEEAGVVSLSSDLSEAVKSTAALPVGAVTSLAETRLYVAKLLGRDAFDELDETDRGLLASAVQKCESDPAGSAEASGQALEDYLRELCAGHGLGAEAVKMNGAGQLATLLRSKGFIHPHHLKLIDAASMFRNAKVHKKDKQTITPWAITAHGARTAFGAATLAIRSINQWIKNGGQEL